MPIRVAIATDDGSEVKSGPFYEARYFAIYDLTGKSPTRIELRVNTRKGKGPSDALDVLRDCEVIVSGKMDAESMDIIESRGIIAYETSKKPVESAIMEIAEGLSRLTK
ncbi:MAG TPA: hypothetical protein ENG69_00285 [Candidatus Korarchaeota archaeon]|nr:hypothetical protein [Candidatus Korarchaeota archaeon]